MGWRDMTLTFEEYKKQLSDMQKRHASELVALKRKFYKKHVDFILRNKPLNSRGHFSAVGYAREHGIGYSGLRHMINERLCP